MSGEIRYFDRGLIQNMTINTEFTMNKSFLSNILKTNINIFYLSIVQQT